jgi:hypothetical protein
MARALLHIWKRNNMTTVNIKLKKSKNVHAWQNSNIGLVVSAEDLGGVYLVNFAANPHLVCNPSWIDGIVDEDEADLV